MGYKVRILLFVPLFAALLAPGCKSSSTPARVSGTVKYNGKLVTGGTIAFHLTGGEATGGNYSCTIKGDGTYSGTDFPSGECIVTVETESINPNPKDRPKDIKMEGGGGVFDPKEMLNKRRGMGGVPEDAGKTTGEYVEIPKKYADPKSSTITKTLTRGSNKVDIDLTD
jgi:hypothetical protein